MAVYTTTVALVRPGFRGVGFLGYDMLLSHQSNGRTAWADGVIQQSFANEFWIWWRRGAAWRTSPGTLTGVSIPSGEWRRQDTPE